MAVSPDQESLNHDQQAEPDSDLPATRESSTTSCRWRIAPPPPQDLGVGKRGIPSWCEVGGHDKGLDASWADLNLIGVRDFLLLTDTESSSRDVGEPCSSNVRRR